MDNTEKIARIINSCKNAWHYDSAQKIVTGAKFLGVGDNLPYLYTKLNLKYIELLDLGAFDDSDYLDSVEELDDKNAFRYSSTHKKYSKYKKKRGREINKENWWKDELLAFSKELLVVALFLWVLFRN